MEVVRVEQMSAVWRQEESTDKAIANTSVVQDTELRDEVATVGIVLNVLDDFVIGWTLLLG